VPVEGTTVNRIKATSWLDLTLLFGIPAILNYLASRIAIPYFDSQQILPIEIIYFLSVGLIVLVPMFFGAIYLSGKDIGSYKLKDLFTRICLTFKQFS
jgi:hypothetical protein